MKTRLRNEIVALATLVHAGFNLALAYGFNPSGRQMAAINVCVGAIELVFYRLFGPDPNASPPPAPPTEG